MRYKVPKFVSFLDEEIVKDIDRFVKLDRKAFELQFKEIDRNGNNYYHYRAKQLIIYMKHLRLAGYCERKVINAMISRSVDPELTRCDLEKMVTTNFKEDKRIKR